MGSVAWNAVVQLAVCPLYHTHAHTHARAHTHACAHTHTHTHTHVYTHKE